MDLAVARRVRIGVVSVQGDVSEHVEISQAALSHLGLTGDVVPLRTAEDAKKADTVVIPGGESTTISKLLVKTGALGVLQRRIRDDGLPVLGTCAGAILLAKEGDNQVEKTHTELIAAMDIAVDRNAFGRQRESFETDLVVKGEKDRVHAVFIRAPAITRVWGRSRVLATFDGRIVAAEEGNLIALAFHPEIAGDARFHVRLLRRLPR
ncbi:MAG: pyridoxal 5'-phosphate synthase glutaminase subunit PdxT [Euryarchaeota archaeon]|nr:pyridoxal 5'-phosphate synthase glutaminase subunit PdxT [Euryarchaeota archaeon]